MSDKDKELVGEFAPGITYGALNWMIKKLDEFDPVEFTARIGEAEQPGSGKIASDADMAAWAARIRAERAAVKATNNN